MCLELNKEYNLMIKSDNKYLYDNEVFYLVKQIGMFDTCYSQKEINDFLKNKYYVEV